MRLKKRGEEKDPWPPVKTTSYITLALMYKKDLPTSEETTQTIFLCAKEDISDICNKVNSQQFCDIAQLFSCQSDSAPNSILIEGHSGIGKTTLVKEICIEWAEGKLLTSDKLVLLLLLRDPNVRRITNTQQLIECFTKSASKVAQLHSYLEDTHGADVTLIIDGYDELHRKFHTQSFFNQLIEKKVLPKARIVITSRPFASANLHDVIDQRVEILGFGPTSRRQYVDEALCYSPFKLEKLQKHFHQYPSIDAICYIPLVMSIIVYLCICQPETLPPTASKMYQSFVIHIICHYLKRTRQLAADELINKEEKLPQQVQQTLKQLGKTAFDGLLEDKIVFTMDEVPNMCKKDPTCYGLLQSIQFYCPEEIGATVKSFNFLHLGIQEYLAAKYVTTLPDDDVHALLKESFLTNNMQGNPDSKCVRLSNMWIIYCGITGGQHNCLRDYMVMSSCKETPLSQQHHYLSGLHDTNHDAVDTQTTSRKINVFSQEGSASNENVSTIVAVSQEILEDPLIVLYLFQCFQEAQDDTLCNILSNAFDDGKINVSGYRFPYQLVSLGFFLSNSHRNWKELSLRVSYIGDHGIQLLHHYLCVNQTSRHEIKTIDLINNDLTGASSLLIGDIITHLKPHTLMLDGNSLYNVKDITTAVFNTTTVKILSMSHSCLTPQELPAICDMMSCLEELDISDNELDDDDAVILSEGIKRTSTLRSLLICQNKISPLGAKIIAERLTCNTSLEVLKMNGNIIGDNGMIEIAKSINTLKELCVVANKIRTTGAIAIANNLSTNTSLRVLNIGVNAIGDNGASALAKAIADNKTLEELHINCNNITATGATAIANSLEQNTSLKALYLSSNDLGQNDATAIVKIIVDNKTLKQLHIMKNNIGATGANAIANALIQNTSLEMLNMSRNGIGNDGTIAIAKAISNNSTLKELALYGDDTINEESYIKLLKCLHCNNSVCKLHFPRKLQHNDDVIKEVQKINSNRRKCETRELKCSLNYSAVQ